MTLLERVRELSHAFPLITVSAKLDLIIALMTNIFNQTPRARLLKTIDQLNEGRGRPSILVKVQQAAFDQILERLMDAFMHHERELGKAGVKVWL